MTSTTNNHKPNNKENKTLLALIKDALEVGVETHTDIIVRGINWATFTQEFELTPENALRLLTVEELNIIPTVIEEDLKVYMGDTYHRYTFYWNREDK